MTTSQLISDSWSIVKFGHIEITHVFRVVQIIARLPWHKVARTDQLGRGARVRGPRPCLGTLKACLDGEGRDRDGAEVARGAAAAVALDVEHLFAQRRVQQIEREPDVAARTELPALRDADVEAIERPDARG